MFVPNVNAQRKVAKPLVVCKDAAGKAFEIDDKCHAVCKADGYEPDPCLGCMDRNAIRCRDEKMTICPDGTEPVVMSVPYQCDWPYRCDPTDVSRYSVKAEPCDPERNKFSIPLCSDHPDFEVPPDTCLQCEDPDVVPTCVGMCPDHYVPTRIPHFFCNNSYQASLNQVENWDRNEFYLFNDAKEDTDLPEGHPRLKADLVQMKDIGNLDIQDEQVKLVPDYSDYACINVSSGQALPMINPCDNFAFPECADGRQADPCLDCHPTSYLTCPNTKVQICPNGTVLERLHSPTFCKYEVSCYEVENTRQMVEPNCELNEKPFCINPKAGLAWPMHFCGCGPEAVMLCMSKKGPGTCLDRYILILSFHEKKVSNFFPSNCNVCSDFTK